MSAAATVLIAAALAIWLAPVAAVVAVYLRERRNDREDSARRAEVTPEWLALLAAVEPTPTYDALVCEHIEKAEGWS